MARYSILSEHLSGYSNEEIVAKWPDVRSSSHVEETIQNTKRRLQENVIENVTKQAEKGDLFSIAWLESCGLLDMPQKAGQGVAENKRRGVAKMLREIITKAEKGDLDSVKWLEERGFLDL